MMTVPGHCLAQAAREFLQLYPTANILVADETNFVKDKRQRFLARAATANWDCIIITHSAFKFIPAPADFERALISDVIGSYVDLLDRVDAEDRVSRKRIERMKEGMEARLEALKARKDDLLTIAEIGVDQVIVDEMQEFRKLTFTTNRSTLKGVVRRFATRLGPLCQGAFPRLEPRARARSDRRLWHADHQHARRNVHDPAVLPA